MRATSERERDVHPDVHDIGIAEQPGPSIIAAKTAAHERGAGRKPEIAGQGEHARDNAALRLGRTEHDRRVVGSEEELITGRQQGERCKVAGNADSARKHRQSQAAPRAPGQGRQPERGASRTCRR